MKGRSKTKSLVRKDNGECKELRGLRQWFGSAKKNGLHRIMLHHFKETGKAVSNEIVWIATLDRDATGQAIDDVWKVAAFITRSEKLKYGTFHLSAYTKHGTSMLGMPLAMSAGKAAQADISSFSHDGGPARLGILDEALATLACVSRELEKLQESVQGLRDRCLEARALHLRKQQAHYCAKKPKAQRKGA